MNKLHDTTNGRFAPKPPPTSPVKTLEREFAEKLAKQSKQEFDDMKYLEEYGIGVGPERRISPGWWFDGPFSTGDARIKGEYLK